ncbi:membrane protein [Paraferrimonas haliotis]|uniref:Membrane protein n=2 Tax=Paraferrimonas haliotis TaxID=2013866 RepID=A0AA37WVN2_9GAMM|nr:membrane protein [Paraferrimonas haliotis]
MFSAAFTAATILPGGSEAVLIGLLSRVPDMALLLLLVASLGNTLGSMTSYLLGRLGRMKITPEQLQQAKYQRGVRWLQQYGVWALLMSWAPVIGDVLCILAGWLKLPVALSSIMILIGKTIRYSIIVALTLHWFG